MQTIKKAKNKLIIPVKINSQPPKKESEPKSQVEYNISGSIMHSVGIFSAYNKEKTNGSRKALIISCTYNILKNPETDIDAISNLLNALGFDTEILNENNKNTIQPTKQNVINLFNQYIKSAKPDDTIFIYYSGKNEETDYEKITLMDGEIKSDELNQLLVLNLPNDVKLRLLFDCNFNNSALNLPYVYDNNNNSTLLNKDVILISGSEIKINHKELVNKQYTGAITWAYVLSIQKLHIGGSSKWNWKDLIYQMRYQLISNGFKQMPILETCSPIYLNYGIFM